METEGYPIQIVMLESIMGPQPRIAPAGWKFDKTAIQAWSKLLYYTEQVDMMMKGIKKHRNKDLMVTLAKQTVLANLLANSLGMAEFYWVQAANKLYNHQR